MFYQLLVIAFIITLFAKNVYENNQKIVGQKVFYKPFLTFMLIYSIIKLYYTILSRRRFTMTTIAERNILTPEETELLEENFYLLVEDYKQNGSLTLSSFVPILGRPPILTHTHDMDAMLEAMDARAEYGNKMQKIEQIFLS